MDQSRHKAKQHSTRLCYRLCEQQQAQKWTRFETFYHSVSFSATLAASSFTMNYFQQYKKLQKQQMPRYWYMYLDSLNSWQFSESKCLVTPQSMRKNLYRVLIRTKKPTYCICNCIAVKPTDMSPKSKPCKNRVVVIQDEVKISLSPRLPSNSGWTPVFGQEVRDRASWRAKDEVPWVCRSAAGLLLRPR